MNRPYQPRRVASLSRIALYSGLAGLLLVGTGCAQSGMSPTQRAMARSEWRSNQLASIDARHSSKSHLAHAANNNSRTLVLSQDHYGRMANPPAFEGSPSTTATASVPTDR